MVEKVRVRFAPSPTGFLHVGGARTALFNFFFARARGGTFVLRIEDTDTARNKPEFEKEILESMKWLGMNWDEGPFYQTKRFDRYAALAEQLLQSKQAYRCYCTAGEIDEMRKKAESEGRKPMYDRRCREGRTPPTPDAPYTIRIKGPLEGEVVIPDGIKGEVRYAASELDDFIIVRSNGTPTYNFTVVVDDVDMRITHVIRAEEHLNNTPKQLIIMRALGWTPPQYAHVPLVLATDKTKLSKRHGAVAVTQFRQEGYLEEAMVNYLARLGWSSGDDREIFSMTELGQLFDLPGCGSSGSVFDRSKLDWFNAHYIKKLTKTDLVARVKALTQVDLAPLLVTPAGEKLLGVIQDSAVKLTDFPAKVGWFLRDRPEMDAPSVESILKPARRDLLDALTTQLKALPDHDWKAEKIGPLFKEIATAHGAKMPDLAKPARILLTGTLASPDIGLVVEALGRDRALARLSAAV